MADPLATQAQAARLAILVPVALLLVLVAVPLVAHYLPGERYVIGLFARVMIFAIAAVSLDLILGFGGLVSFGHAAFIGLGAYAVGILAAHEISDAAIVVPVAIAGAALFALATGAIAVRTRGVYFIMITLAFGQMAYYTATSLSQYGGDDGISLLARSTVFGARLLDDPRSFYYVVLAVLAAVYLLCRMVVASRFGRVLRAARENVVRTETLGYNVNAVRVVAYMIAGCICALAGFLLANQASFVSPAYMSWQRSGELIVMVVLGGMGSLHGAVLGSLAYLLLEEWLAGYTEHWKVIFGPLLVLVVLFARGGLLGIMRGGGRG
jgi:branched-chain amino acid transport system permease protein